MKNIWIIANWKSNKTIAEAITWIEKVGPEVPKQENLNILICPTFSCLSDIKKVIQVNSFPIMVGSQDLSPFGTGAYTGEESATLLKDLVSHSIIGHSERRKNFAEDDQLIASKISQALKNAITPILCVQDENTNIPVGCKIVAYEPVWAIGSGTPDTPENANNIANKLKQKVNDLIVIYGGSVNSENIKVFLDQENINGALIGGASLNADEFIKICQAVVEKS